ncbi:methionyl-tRNA formyltransferase [Roseivirga misakiensis]|uniref:Methionyl-tRNA formyltransferase n=2 Tax=Roseivirga misakiensis TaxID=1563681 RepID=A0A1E5T2A7_9BACT|nr:methionyl-tRNA formyltransferase [Roseivirga misakiensis]
MGTPEFAVPSLQILVENSLNVVAVITAPDRPKGRGRKLTTTPVKDYAVSQNIPVLQPTNLKNPEFLEELKGYNANLQIVVAFRMLPVAVWDMPEIGTFNLHGSLLPQYRGAAPINWAIINGEKETGVTTFFLKHEIDTGNIIFQEKEPIDENDNVGDVYERLMRKGAQLVLRTVEAIQKGDYPQEVQDESVDIKHAPKIFKETCEIDWSKSADEVHNFVRGLSPYPAAWSILNGKKFKIYETKKVNSEQNIGEPGTVETDNKSYLNVMTGSGPISIASLQMDGKKRMDIKSFLLGNTL